MGTLTFTTNVTLDGCIDHMEGIADMQTHAVFTRLLEESAGMIWGRVTYELMESYWPGVAKGDTAADPAMYEWAVKLDASPKYVVSSTRTDFPWVNSHHLTGDLETAIARLKDETRGYLLVGSCKLANALDRLDLIDEYRFLIQARIAGHGPTLFEGGLNRARKLDLVSCDPLGNGVIAVHYRRA